MNQLNIEIYNHNLENNSNSSNKINLFEILKKILSCQKEIKEAEGLLFQLKIGNQELDCFKNSDIYKNAIDKAKKYYSNQSEIKAEEESLKYELNILKQQKNDIETNNFVLKRSEKLKEVENGISIIKDKIDYISRINSKNYKEVFNQNDLVINEIIKPIVDKYYFGDNRPNIDYESWERRDDLEHVLSLVLYAFKNAILLQENKIKKNNNYIDQIMININIEFEILTNLLQAYYLIENSKNEQQVKKCYELIENYKNIVREDLKTLKILL